MFGKRDFFLEDGGVYLGWRNDYRKKARECDFYLTLFVKNESGTFDKFEEMQTEKLWTDTEIEQMLSESGLETVAVFSGFDMKKAKEEDEKRFYVVRCPENK